MTRSRDKGSNEITDEAKRRAMREGAPIAEILAQMLLQAKAARDSAKIKKIEQAQKYLGTRNIRKRESNQ